MRTTVAASRSQSTPRTRAPTSLTSSWDSGSALNPAARLVCLDIQPYASTQAPEREDILNIGGFSDAVFTLIDQFARGKLQSGHWVGVIESQQLATA